jgi:hypothetical protein
LQSGATSAKAPPRTNPINFSSGRKRNYGEIAYSRRRSERSAYTLVIEFENNSSLTVNVKPTPESSGPSEKWMNCLAAFLQHQRPPQ